MRVPSIEVISVKKSIPQSVDKFLNFGDYSDSYRDDPVEIVNI